jgi:hypothetical protein
MKYCPRCSIELDEYGTKGYCSVQCYSERGLSALPLESRVANAMHPNFDGHSGKTLKGSKRSLAPKIEGSRDL